MSGKGSRAGSIFRSMFTLRTDMASYEEIDNTIVSGSKLYGTNACILILAILVASIGLNMNSTAVIIGAMLISPLMGGIIAIAYGIATNDLGLAKWSAFRLTIQVVISVITSFVYFSLSPITTASSELLARTSPTVWDVLIATCGGFAGIIGQTRKEKSNVIPGVAIATALMPPLCTAGYGLARRNWQYFSGAIYLFFINGFFICLTAIIVLKYLRVPQYRELDRKSLSRIHRNIGIIAVITMIPSIVFAYDTVSRSIQNSNAESYIKNEFSFSGTQVVSKNIDLDEKVIEISVIGTEITAEEEMELEDKLMDYDLDGYTLKLTQTTVKSGMTAEEVKELLAEYDNKDGDKPDLEGVVLAKENEELSSELERLREENEELSSQIEAAQEETVDLVSLTEQLKALDDRIEGASVSDTRIYVSEERGEEEVMIVTVLVNKTIDDAKTETLSEWLRVYLGKDNVVLFQQRINDYFPEEEKAEESSGADESSEAEESSRTEKKKDKD